ncbi:MAG: alpha/beta hydrolase-fold protein [Ignavibacteria bacterium]|nr:alpha/beta hydrolase-fold protein [Ignavibacteria bacterium]
MRRIIMLFLATIAVSSLLHPQANRTELRSLTVPGGGNWSFNVYLPPGYDRSTERYPVVYLFRGAVDEWLDRAEDASRNGRNIQDITDTLIAQGKMGGVILVMPGFTAMTGPASEADYAFILNTLIPFIDQNYRTLPSRWHRGLDGFSLGGLHMVNLIWRNPERFASAGSYDGSLFLFNFTQMIAAGEPYFARLRPIQFLLHSAAIAPSNLSDNRRFDTLLNSYGIHNISSDLLFSTTSQHNWWNADEHMIRALPLHWSKFQAPPHNVPLFWTSTLPARAAGTVRLSWSIGRASDSLKTMVEYSKNAGASWQTLLFASRRDSVFDWNTRNDLDGTRYLARIQVFGDTSYGILQATPRFTVDNPGNSPPDALFLSPQKNEKASGTYLITWSAEDPEGDPVRTSIYGSSDNGKSWQTIVTDISNTGSYAWSSQFSANSPAYLLKLRCSDGALTSEVISEPIEITNAREPIAGIRHTAGGSDGRVVVNIVDRSRLTGHTYRILFDDTTSTQKLYNVLDGTNSTYLLRNTPFVGDGSEGPSFDGLRLRVFDYPLVSNNRDSTRWTKGNSTLTSQITVPTFSVGNETIKGVAYPSDYEIRIADRIVDTSSTLFGAGATPLSFTVWNTTENHRVPVIISELDGDGKISRFDDMFILEKDRHGQFIVTWEIFFSGDERAVLPVTGDVFTLKTIKPIRSNDVFEFTSTATGIAGEDRLIPDAIELFQNYPNPFNPTTTIRYQLSVISGVKLSVFDILGREVALLVQEQKEAGHYSVQWNASVLASGLYFYQLSVVPSARRDLVSTEGRNGEAGNNVITKKALLLK